MPRSARPAAIPPLPQDPGLDATRLPVHLPAAELTAFAGTAPSRSQTAARLRLPASATDAAAPRRAPPAGAVFPPLAAALHGAPLPLGAARPRPPLVAHLSTKTHPDPVAPADRRGAGGSASRRTLYKRQAAAILTDPPRSLRGASNLACLAVAVYHEARDQPLHGQLAVASVVLERARTPGRWGATPCAVVKPVAFSFMRSTYGYARIDEPRAWNVAVKVALRTLLVGPLPELRGADHYHTTAVAPHWRHSMVRIGRIGDHIFYRDPAS